MGKVKVATVWLDGCSGCHMSFLDLDERLIELAEHIEMVYSPVVDPKSLPDEVDLAIIEGAVSNDDDKQKVLKMRKHSKFLISLGDCAVSGNVPAMRNPIGAEVCFQRAYHELADLSPQDPTDVVPPLLTNAMPVHEVVKVDLWLQGCPPPADAIYHVLTELVAGRVPNSTEVSRFGA